MAFSFLSKKVLLIMLVVAIGFVGVFLLFFSNKLEGLANNNNNKDEEKKTIPVPSPPYYSSLPSDAYADMATVQANLSSQSEYDTTAY